MNSREKQDRKRRIPLIRSFLILLVAWICWYTGPANSPRPESPVHEPTLEDFARGPLESPPVEYHDNTCYVVRSGDTFAGIFADMGICGGEAVSFYNILESIGMNAIFPGDSLTVVRDSASRIQSFSLLNKLQHWYHVRRDSLGIRAERYPLQVTRHRWVAKGLLENSLSEDLYHLGVGDALVSKLVDIFAWDINFFMDPRKGDRFEILFEKIFVDGRFVRYGDILAAKYIRKDKEFCAIGLLNAEGKMEYYDKTGRSVQKQFLKAPLKFNRISSGFTHSRKHPILGIYRPHLGIDYAAPRGTPVYAAADGTVNFAGNNGGYGKHIRISHGASYTTYYGHLHRIAKGIHRGARVSQGQYIGTVGSTGLSTGPHLDYRMKRAGEFVNPMTVNLPSKEGISIEDRPRFECVLHEYRSVLEWRFEDSGCFLVDVIEPPARSPDKSTNTYADGTTHGDSRNSDNHS